MFAFASCHLLTYLSDPSTVVTHVIACGLLVALCIQGAISSRLTIFLVSVLEELISYLLWVTCPYGLGAVAAIWIFLNFYEQLLGPGLALQNNAVLQSGESYIGVVLQQTTGLQFHATEDDGGQFYVHTNLQFAAFSRSLWFKQVNVDERICLEDVAGLDEGCSFELLKRFRCHGIQRDRLITLTMENGESLTVVLVSETKSTRDQWMAVLHQILGTQIIDVRSVWLTKLMSTHSFGLSNVDKKTSLEDAMDILSAAGRPFNRSYAHELFKKMTRTNGIKWKLTDTSTMNKDQFYSFFAYAVHRPEIAEIYNKLIDQSHGKATLNRARFQEFVREDQKEDASKETIRRWILKSEPVLRCLNLSNIGSKI